MTSTVGFEADISAWFALQYLMFYQKNTAITPSDNTGCGSTIPPHVDASASGSASGGASGSTSGGVSGSASGNASGSASGEFSHLYLPLLNPRGSTGGNNQNPLVPPPPLFSLRFLIF